MSAAKKHNPHPNQQASNATHKHAHAAESGAMTADNTRLVFALALSAAFLLAMSSHMSLQKDLGDKAQWHDEMLKF